MAENKTADPPLAQIGGTTYGDKIGWAQHVVTMPARTRLVVASSGFGGDQVGRIEVLTSACVVIGDFHDFITDGSVIIISDGPRAEVG